MIKLEYGDLSGMKSELQGFRDLSAFRHFEIGGITYVYHRYDACGADEELAKMHRAEIHILCVNNR